MDRHSAGWRRRAKNRCEHKFADPRVHLGRADRDLVREMLSQRLVIQRPAGLPCE
jgi:hypothetical protein